MHQTLPAQIPQTTSLPALVRSAAHKLAQAETSAEVLDARQAATFTYDAAKSAARVARAKQAHDEIVAAVYRAQADALVIEAAAKHRLADEYDAAQERGEVATVGKPVIVPDGNNKATTTEIGLSRKEIHEARKVRDAEEADPGVVQRTVDTLLADGKEPTRAAVNRKIAATKAKPEQTPDEPMEAAEATDARRAGAKMFLPDGADIVDLCRRGIALEEDGQTIDDAADEVGMARNAYRVSRQIVLLSDRSELSPRDKATSAEALRVLETTLQYARAWEIAEPVAIKVWGHRARGLKLTGLAERRLEQFERTFAIVIQSCLTTDEVELPYLSVEQIETFTKEIQRAKKALTAFASRIEEMHA